jgi:hypothetical protein
MHLPFSPSFLWAYTGSEVPFIRKHDSDKGIYKSSEVYFYHLPSSGSLTRIVTRQNFKDGKYWHRSLKSYHFLYFSNYTQEVFKALDHFLGGFPNLCEGDSCREILNK